MTISPSQQLLSLSHGASSSSSASSQLQHSHHQLQSNSRIRYVHVRRYDHHHHHHHDTSTLAPHQQEEEAVDSEERWPAPRDGHTCVYVPSLRQILLFGGKHVALQYLDDTAALHIDTLRWTVLPSPSSSPLTPAIHSSTPLLQSLSPSSLPPPSPPPSGSGGSSSSSSPIHHHHYSHHYSRCNHASVLYRQYMLVFGGYMGSPRLCFFNDLLLYDTTAHTWHNINTINNTARSSDSSSSSSNDHSGHSHYQRHDQVPPPRSEHTLMLKLDHLHPERDCLVVFGGYCGHRYLNDMWTLRLRDFTWHRVKYDYASVVQWPSPRASHTAVVRRNGCAHDTQRMVVFAGDASGQLLNDIMQFEFDTNMWTHITPNPNAMNVRGGGNDTNNDPITTNNTAASTAVVPRARRGHRAVMLDRLDKMIIFGGYNSDITIGNGNGVGGVTSSPSWWNDDVADLCDCFEFDFRHQLWTRIELTTSPLFHTVSPKVGLHTVVTKKELQHTAAMLSRSYHQMVLLEGDQQEEAANERTDRSQGTTRIHRKMCGTVRMAILMGFDSVERLNDVCFLELQESEEPLQMQRRLWQTVAPGSSSSKFFHDCEIVTVSSGTETRTECPLQGDLAGHGTSVVNVNTIEHKSMSTTSAVCNSDTDSTADSSISCCSSSCESDYFHDCRFIHDLHRSSSASMASWAT